MAEFSRTLVVGAAGRAAGPVLLPLGDGDWSRARVFREGLQRSLACQVLERADGRFLAWMEPAHKPGSRVRHRIVTDGRERAPPSPFVWKPGPTGWQGSLEGRKLAEALCPAMGRVTLSLWQTGQRRATIRFAGFADPSRSAPDGSPPGPGSRPALHARQAEPTLTSGAVTAELSVPYLWTAADGRPMLEESQAIRLWRTADDSTLLEFEVVWTASAGPILIAETEDGAVAGIGRREDELGPLARPALNVQPVKGVDATWRIWPDRPLLGDSEGFERPSEADAAPGDGAVRSETRSPRSFVGPLAVWSRQERSLAVLTDPGSFGDPCRWSPDRREPGGVVVRPGTGPNRGEPLRRPLGSRTVFRWWLRGSAEEEPMAPSTGLFATLGTDLPVLTSVPIGHAG